MKGYWIAHVTVTDPDSYQKYVDGTAAAFEKYGARFLARGGKCEQLEGEGHPRNVVIEFDSMAQALACYHSPEYQAARAHRVDAGIANLMIMEGVA